VALEDGDKLVLPSNLLSQCTWNLAW